MVFRMKGKRVWYGRIPERAGEGKTVCLRTRDRETAEAMQGLLTRLRHQRKWRLLDAARDGQVTVAELYDADQMGAVDQVLERLADVDVEPHVTRWEAQYRTTAAAPTADQYVARVRRLIPAGVPAMRSTLTPERIGQWIAALEMGNLGRQGYYKALGRFLDYLVRIAVLPESPMAKVSWPKGPKPDVVWLSQPDMQRVCDAGYEPYRSFFYLAYGTGIEVSVAIALRRRDVDLAKREIFAPGTKTWCRERTVRVAEWAWPQIEQLCRGLLPDAKLFPEIHNRHAPSWQHRRVCKELGLAGYRLHDARHSWAVRAARAGTPVEIIARQLGHADATMVTRLYGRFLPDQHDRDRWERLAAAQDAGEHQASATSTATSTS